MSDALAGAASDRAASLENANLAALGAADWLRLAAAPTFALMALLTGADGGGPGRFICSAAASPLGGMATMYFLMVVFHLPPWLKLIFGRPGVKI